MRDLTTLSDAGLIEKIIEAERKEDVWRDRYVRYGAWHRKPSGKGQEAKHTFYYWAGRKAKLYAEENGAADQMHLSSVLARTGN